MDNEKLMKAPIVNYRETAVRLLKNQFPNIGSVDLEQAVNYAIGNSYKEHKAVIDNSYNHRQVNTTLLELVDFIESRQPIITSYGVMFAKHSQIENPISKMIQGFLASRSINKDKMYEYPVGSEMFEKFNLKQLLDKIDANGSYGAIGMYSCLFYNLYVAASVTTQGRAYISSAILLFESFMNDNVPFGSLNEIVFFIDSVKREKRTFNDNDILNRNIMVEEVFYKIMTNVAWGYIPSEEDCCIVWEILLRSSQEDLNRLFYKNNLFGFMNNESARKAVVLLLSKLTVPYLDPNHPPEEIKAELEAFYELLYEYVYYKEVIMDKLDKVENLVRSVSIITDTDSTFVSFDGWFRFVNDLVKDIDMTIKHEEVDMIKVIDGEEGSIEFVDEYDFETDEIIQVKRTVDRTKVIAQDSLRYSIVNIMAYCCGHLVNDYMERITKNTHSYDEGKKCLIMMKNEIQLKRALLTDGKKNYAGLKELQEGHTVPEEKALDVKGMPVFIKSTVNKKTRETLKKILYDEILNTDNVDQIKVLKALAKAEKDIFNSINNGSREYYKPLRVKSKSNYDKPMSQQGIKASIVYNALKDDSLEAIDLNSRNSIDVIKIDITPDNISLIQEEYPEVYNKAIALMNDPEGYFSNGIDVIGLPLNIDVPKWILKFVRYSDIINDNISGFPLESIGLFRNDSSYINYTNIVTL